MRTLTKRARLDGQLCIYGVGDADRLHQKCADVASEACMFLNYRGESVHFSKLTRTDIAAMSLEEYQRFARLAPLLLGDSTQFLPEPGALIVGMNAAGQFLSGSFSDAPEHDF